MSSVEVYLIALATVVGIVSIATNWMTADMVSVIRTWLDVNKPSPPPISRPWTREEVEEDDEAEDAYRTD